MTYDLCWHKFPAATQIFGSCLSLEHEFSNPTYLSFLNYLLFLCFYKRNTANKNKFIEFSPGFQMVDVYQVRNPVNQWTHAAKYLLKLSPTE